MGYHLSASAHADIDEIWDFIAEDNPAAAERFTAMLREKFSILASQPQMGRACAELRPGLHRFPIGNYVVFYRPVADQVEIARVLHARGISKPFSKRKKLHESRAHKGPSPPPGRKKPCPSEGHYAGVGAVIIGFSSRSPNPRFVRSISAAALKRP